jgi:DNA-binding PadR family transcriptional regulator
VAVLEALAADPDRWRYGYDLCTELGLLAGSMYPILIRLADRGLLETGWETEHVPGRPPRHLYRLTGAGREFVAALTADAPAPARRGTGTAASARRTRGADATARGAKATNRGAKATAPHIEPGLGGA